MVLLLILIIAIIVLVAVFSGFNLQNACNIWVFGKTFENVPVFVTVLVSFAAGIFITLIMSLFKPKKKLTAEQARAQAERLELQQKKKLEKQLKMQKKLEAQNERALKSLNIAPAAQEQDEQPAAEPAPAAEKPAKKKLFSKKAKAEEPVQEEGK